MKRDKLWQEYKQAWDKWIEFVRKARKEQDPGAKLVLLVAKESWYIKMNNRLDKLTTEIHKRRYV